MDTKLTVDEIQLALRNSGMWNKRQDIFVPNLSWGLLNHEADLAIMSKSGYLTEVEIKRSWEDFKADFKKGHEHNDPRVYYFHYCVPVSIKDRVVEFLENKYLSVGMGAIPDVLCFTETGRIERVPKGYSRRGGRKLFLEEQLTVARLGCMRVWNLKEKLLQQELPSSIIPVLRGMVNLYDGCVKEFQEVGININPDDPEYIEANKVLSIHER